MLRNNIFIETSVIFCKSVYVFLNRTTYCIRIYINLCFFCFTTVVDVIITRQHFVTIDILSMEILVSSTQNRIFCNHLL